MPKNKYLKIILSLLLVILMAGFASFNNAKAIGMISKPIVVTDALRGQEIIESLKLLNSEEGEAYFLLLGEGQIEKWVSFYETQDKDLKNPITEINIPGRAYQDAIVKISIPEDTPNGEYSGQVMIASKPGEGSPENQTSAVSQKVGRDVTITVTDKEIFALEASIFPLSDPIKNGDPLKIQAIFANQGNVKIKPNLQLKITQDDNTVFNAIFPYPEDLEAVKPGERKTMPVVEWQTAGQENGQYLAKVTITVNNEVKAEEQFPFTISALGVLGEDTEEESHNNKFLAAVTALGGGHVVIGWLVIGAILIALAAIPVVLVKMQRASAQNQKSSK